MVCCQHNLENWTHRFDAPKKDKKKKDKKEKDSKKEKKEKDKKRNYNPDSDGEDIGDI